MSKHAVCDLCGGTFIRSTISMHLWHEKQLVVVSDVPAETCEQCAQSHVDPDVSARIEHYLHHCTPCQPKRYIQVPEFSAAQILNADS